MLDYYPWWVAPIPAADNTPPCDLTGDAPDMLDSARAGEGVFMAQPVALFSFFRVDNV